MAAKFADKMAVQTFDRLYLSHILTDLAQIETVRVE